MNIKRKKHISYPLACQLGKTMRAIRGAKKIKTDYIAYKLGYADKSTYCKLERGELRCMDLFLLLDICNLLDCNLVELLHMSGIDIFKNNRIRTFKEFHQSLRYTDTDKKAALAEIVHNINEHRKLDPPL